MSLTPVAYRKTEFTHRAGLSVDKPAAGDVLIGTLYFSTDTSVLERSDGSTWSTYSGGGGGGGLHASTHSDGGTDEVNVTNLGGYPGGGTTFLRDDGIFASAGSGGAHATTHEPGGTDQMAVDAIAATGSLRTLGTGANQAAAGNDSRLTNARTPTAHATSHSNAASDPVTVTNLAGYPGGSTTFLRADATFAAPSVSTHASTHSSGSSDPVTVTNLAGFPGTTTTVLRGDATFATPAMVKIDEQSPTGTSVTFSSLGTYTHLLIKVMGRGDTAAIAVAVNMTFNGDTSAIYDREGTRAHATTNTLSESLAQTSINTVQVSAATATSGLAGSGEIYIFDYRGTTFHKSGTVLSTYKTSNATDNINLLTAAWAWRSTAAITSITITLAAGNWVSGSKVSLYGIS